MRVILIHVREAFDTNFYIKLEKNLQGYIALMATIIIGAVLLVITVGVSTYGSRARFTILATEAKEQATTLAEGCGEQAAARILTDKTYQGGATSTYAVGTCYVFPLAIHSPTLGVVTIRVQGKVRSAVTNLELQFDMKDVQLDTQALPPVSAPSLPIPDFAIELISSNELPSLP